MMALYVRGMFTSNTCVALSLYPLSIQRQFEFCPVKFNHCTAIYYLNSTQHSTAVRRINLLQKQNTGLPVVCSDESEFESEQRSGSLSRTVICGRPSKFLSVLCQLSVFLVKFSLSPRRSQSLSSHFQLDHCSQLSVSAQNQLLHVYGLAFLVTRSLFSLAQPSQYLVR